ncbi:Clp protease N-terminal domain-containing protein [Hamadaea tsunoensis]|uniref:Clp protease N-terminal domain-containing protein n=1 Tax=Hamadaea tsunoensis TaxID=53368 RepID=UPI000418E4B6|nr:Clp protease N-terminal domain-containing protein [Hamadaea tsunoensis]
MNKPAPPRWTDRARRVADAAAQHAAELGHDQISPEHYLIALLDGVSPEEGWFGIVGQVLANLRIPVADLRSQTLAVLQRGGTPDSSLGRVLRAAEVESRLTGGELLGTEDLLLALVVEGTTPAARLLVEAGARPDRLREEIDRVLRVHGGGVAPEHEPVHRTSLPDHLRDLQNELDAVRRAKEAAIDSGDYVTAGRLRDEEKEVLVRRAAAVTAWAPTVDTLRVVREVEYLRAEVQRLTQLLADHGIGVDDESPVADGCAPGSP